MCDLQFVGDDLKLVLLVRTDLGMSPVRLFCYINVLQCVAMCCNVLQCCVAGCCRVLQGVAVRCSTLQYVAVRCSLLQSVAVCCSLLLLVRTDSCTSPVRLFVTCARRIICVHTHRRESLYSYVIYVHIIYTFKSMYFKEERNGARARVRERA